jgi:hypothetical protein
VGHGCKLTCAALINNFSYASHQYAWTTRRTAACKQPHPSIIDKKKKNYVINSRERAHAVDLKLQASSLTRMKVARASAQASGPGTAVGRRELGESSSRLVRHGKRLRGSSTPSWVLAPWVLPTGRIRGHDDELLLLLLILLLLLPPPIRPPQISPLLLPASSSCCNNVKTDHDPNSTASEEHKSTKLHTKQSNKQTKSISLSEQFFFFFLGLWRMDSAAEASIGENLQITDTKIPATNLASNSNH